jgi:hypothetical protein
VRATVANECVLWGCLGLSFKANLPFDGMRHAASSAELQVFAAFLKEIPSTLFACLRTDTHRQELFSKR